MANDDTVLTRAQQLLSRLCDDYGIDVSHGVEHAAEVLAHTREAVNAAQPPLPAGRALAVQLAALLHDADDHKYFGKESSKALTNARRILSEAGAEDPAVTDDVCYMISLVSCSANGNSCPPRARDEPELLWPRWADRLEAAGEIGVARCYLHNQKDGAPLAVDGETPRVTTDEEAFRLATEERFAAYQQRGGASASMIDHYFDKLLQVARPAPQLVRNPYLEREAGSRVAPLLDVLKAYGATGQVPVASIEGIIEKLGLRNKKGKKTKRPEEEDVDPQAAGARAADVEPKQAKAAKC